MKLLKKKSSPATPENTEKPMYTNLRQVMDYTKPLSIFFSGVEYEEYLDILYSIGIRNFLMSYEYLKGKGLSQLKKYPDIRLFIDSGAYTYQNDPKYENYTLEQWEKQIKEYLTWVEKHKSQIFAICDLDLQYVVGNEPVYEWREKYFEPFMLRTGIPVCFMFHDEGLEHWEYMCKRYPYVGLSLAIDNKVNGYQELKDMFKIAEKHNSLCQGMASTKTSLLIEFPFYTVDSTTWNVGLKYGEISVWNKTKMQRIKKEDFETKAFPVISHYDMNFDFDKILVEDKTEMIKVNAYAFVMAEKFIRERLKSSMYWFKKKTIKRSLDELPENFYPPCEWFDNKLLPNLRNYALSMNINPDLEDCPAIVCDITTLMNWDNPDYSELVKEYLETDGKLLRDIHNSYINRIVGTNEERVEDLQKYFTEIVTGKNDSLLVKGTNFDRIIKERDENEYVTEEETELVDISQEEIHNRLKMLLPDKSSSDSTVDDLLNEEVCRQIDVIPTFDEHGKFVKGQVAVRKPKQVYSKKYPKLACDNCYAAAKCPEFKSGYVCAYNKMFDRFSSRDMGDVIQSMQGIVDYNMSRMQRAMIMETLSGGFDPMVSQLMDTNIRYMQMLKQMYEVGSPEVLRQTKVIRADGSAEETTTLTNPQSGGIMEKLFGSMMKSQQEPEVTEENVIEVNKNESES